MCSLGGEDLILIDESPLSSGSKKCKKCDITSDVVIRQRDTYCTNCFVLTTNHKFRATLGKSKLIRANENVLLCLSGGIASMTLLELVRNGVNAESHKKLRITPICIHIDESNLDPDMQQNCNFILTQTLAAGFPCYIVPLSTYFSESFPLSVDALPSSNNEDDDRMNEFFASISCDTSVKEARIKLRNSVIVKVAAQLNSNFVLTGESSTSLASTMLADVALGRGSQLESEVGFIDGRYENVKILRPMRDITFEELNLLSAIQKVEYLKSPTTHTNSIQSLIEKFVNGLQVNFPATISTVCRTGEKLTDDSPSEQDSRCEFCRSPLDTQFNKSSALQATEFSRLVSKGPEAVATNSNCDNDDTACVDCQCSQEIKLTRKLIEKYLCYGCRLIFRDIKDDSKIPNKLIEGVKTRLAMEKMRNEINEFLL